MLFGKSGLGKSSLINAGLLPNIEEEEHYKSLLIRMKSYSTEQLAPVQKVVNAVREELLEHPLAVELEHARAEKSTSLWYEFKKKD